MVKLSILIAATDETRLEASLVSVLENRPADCEIVVVHDQGYPDPYALAGEVRFVFVAPVSDEITRLAAGLRSCQAALVHILRCGVTVSEGWTDAAVAHFADPRVAAVSSLVISPGGSRVESAGIEYRPGGRRIVRTRHAQIAAAGDGPTPILGPTLDAAFYRLATLRELDEAFSVAVGEELADVDLALRLARGGYRTVLEPKSRQSSPCRPCGVFVRSRTHGWRNGYSGGTRASLACCAPWPVMPQSSQLKLRRVLPVR